jgi:hypothetical protein
MMGTEEEFVSDSKTAKKGEGTTCTAMTQTVLVPLGRLTRRRARTTEVCMVILKQYYQFTSTY